MIFTIQNNKKYINTLSFQISFLVTCIFIVIQAICRGDHTGIYLLQQKNNTIYYILEDLNILGSGKNLEALDIIYGHLVLILYYSIVFTFFIFLLRFLVAYRPKLGHQGKQFYYNFIRLFLKAYSNALSNIVLKPIIVFISFLVISFIVYTYFDNKGMLNYPLSCIVVLGLIFFTSIIIVSYLLLSNILYILGIKNSIVDYAKIIVTAIFYTTIFLYISLVYISPALFKLLLYLIAKLLAKKTEIIFLGNNNLILYSYYILLVIYIVYHKLFKELKMLYKEFDKKDLYIIKFYSKEFLSIVLKILLLLIVFAIAISLYYVFHDIKNSSLGLDSIFTIVEVTKKKVGYSTIFCLFLYLSALLPLFFIYISVLEIEVSSVDAYISSKEHIKYFIKTFIKTLFSTYFYTIIFISCLYLITIYATLNLYPTESWFTQPFIQSKNNFLDELTNFTFVLFYLFTVFFLPKFIRGLIFRTIYENRGKLPEKQHKENILVILNCFFILLFKAVIFFIIFYIAIRINFAFLEIPLEIHLPKQNLYLKLKNLNRIYAITIYPALFINIVLAITRKMATHKHHHQFIPEAGYYVSEKNELGLPINIRQAYRSDNQVVVNEDNQYSEWAATFFLLLFSHKSIYIADYILFIAYGNGALCFFIPTYILFFITIKELIYKLLQIENQEMIFYKVAGLLAIFSLFI